MSAAAAELALASADAAAARSDVDATVAHLAAAIRGFTAAGEPVRSAMACVRLGQLYENALGNAVAARAWFTRAWRSIEREPACVEQGWVAIASLGCTVPDPAQLLAAAELALDRARRFGDVNLETKALADAGLAHVQAGRAAEGMALLDESMALACGPADNNGVAAMSACSFFTACYYVADFARASSWAGPLRQHGLIGSARGEPIFLSNHCDSVQAALLIELGRWSEAEAVLTRASAAFEATMHGPAWHPTLGLADLRVRQGRFDEAEALLLGKDQFPDALLPMTRLHLARGDGALARAAALRGLRALQGDRPRAVELLILRVDAELLLGDNAAASEAVQDLVARTEHLDAPALRARALAAQARAIAAQRDLHGAIALLEPVVDRLDAAQTPWLRARLQLELARLRERIPDIAAASADARAAAAALASLDVELTPVDAALLARLTSPSATQPTAPLPSGARAPSTTLRRDGKWWSISAREASVRIPDSKGMRYLAVLLESPGIERHALDLVDRVEGVDPDAALDRRAFDGSSGATLDARARAAYRHRIEALRGVAEEALAEGRFEAAEAAHDELNQLVAQLAQAVGLGGRERKTGSVAERARLNVTRALRASTAKISEALPEAGAALDRQLRTGVFCSYDPAANAEIRWVFSPD